MVETLLGPDGPGARDVMQNILLVGQTKISDLREAYKEKIHHHTRAGKQSENLIDKEDEDVNSVAKKSVVPVESLARLNSVLCRLAEAELIDVVTPRSFQTAGDIYREVKQDVINDHFPGGPRGAKQKDELQEKLAKALKLIEGEPKSLKRKLEQNGHGAAKRRKIILNGDVANGDHLSDADPTLDGHQVIRINYQKCLVELRNRRLIQYVMEMVGQTTGQVYATLLGLLSRKVSRCRPDPVLDSVVSDDDPESEVSQGVTTEEILNHLGLSVDVSLGIGKASSSKIDLASADTVRIRPPREEISYPEADVQGKASSDEDMEDDGEESAEESDHEYQGNHSRTNSQPNGTKEVRVKFQEPGLNRIDHLRQHLLLLCESKQKFVRHCGSNEWTVDFRPLVRRLQEAEVDVVIERTSGRHGLRLARILREKGKLDEKNLPTIALMKKSDVQNKMLEMQMAGFVDIQEVPRDNNRTASRTMFLWFSDTDRCLGQLLENTYKAMLRCMQTLIVHREKERDVLAFTKRTDVRGKEKETMETAYYEKYSKFLDLERKLLGHVMRLDDMVAVLRDY